MTIVADPCPRLHQGTCDKAEDVGPPPSILHPRSIRRVCCSTTETHSLMEFQHVPSKAHVRLGMVNACTTCPWQMVAPVIEVNKRVYEWVGRGRLPSPFPTTNGDGSAIRSARSWTGRDPRVRFRVPNRGKMSGTGRRGEVPRDGARIPHRSGGSPRCRNARRHSCEAVAHRASKKRTAVEGEDASHASNDVRKRGKGKPSR